jgi:hypothetical protein
MYREKQTKKYSQNENGNLDWVEKLHELITTTGRTETLEREQICHQGVHSLAGRAN